MRCAKRARVNAPAHRRRCLLLHPLTRRSTTMPLQDCLCQHLAACRHARASGERSPRSCSPRAATKKPRSPARYSRPIIASLKCSKESAVRSRLPIAVSLAIGATPALRPSRRRFRRGGFQKWSMAFIGNRSRPPEAVALVTRSLPACETANEVRAPWYLHKPGDRGPSASARGGSPPGVIRFMDGPMAHPSPAAAEKPSSAINFHSAFSAAASFASSTLRSTM